MKPSDVIFTLKCLPETAPVRGNLIATGDPEADRIEEDRVIRELETNPWAWCVVKVTAVHEATGFEGVAYLGACSYRNEEYFKACATFDDLKTEALDDLKNKLRILTKVR